LKLVFKPVLKTPDEIRALCLEANDNSLNRHQSAHGDRKAGSSTRACGSIARSSSVTGSIPVVQSRLAAWMRAARAWRATPGAKFARFGDNMRQAAVTDGDKVSAEIRFGYAVNGYGWASRQMGRRRQRRRHHRPDGRLRIARHRRESAAPRGRPARFVARGCATATGPARAFLADGGVKGFTTMFADLHGLGQLPGQLPGLASQRLMADSYGLGAEGDRKTAALLRAMEVMGAGLMGGTSFMEDYSCPLHPQGHQVLRANRLEIGETTAATKPSLEIHARGIGGKKDPVRLGFDAPPARP
jgi:L-arabinose isomerase